MARSFRKKNFIGICGSSEKRDKKYYSKSLRSVCKSLLKRRLYYDLPKHEGNRHGGNWNFNKDGKLRFNPDKYPQLSRK